MACVLQLPGKKTLVLPHTCVLCPTVRQAAAGAVAVRVRHVGGRRVSVHGAGVGVAQRAPIGRAARERAVVLRVTCRVQPVHRVDVGQSGGGLLVPRVSVAELQKGRLGGIDLPR